MNRPAKERVINKEIKVRTKTIQLSKRIRKKCLKFAIIVLN